MRFLFLFFVCWWMKSSWSKTRIFAASTITQYWLDNTIIIIFLLTMQPLFTGWKRQIVVFQKLQAKHPSGFNQIYTQHLNGYDKATYKISFFPDVCFTRKWRLKFRVSKYYLRWNAENMTSSIMSPKKKLHNYRFYEHFTTGNRLVCTWEITVSNGDTCIPQS